jgi:hypothetical protein
VLLAFFRPEILASRRSAFTLAGSLRAAARVRLAYDGAINAAILLALSPGRARRLPDGQKHEV